MRKENFYGIALDKIDTNELLILCDKYLSSQEINTIYFLNAHYYNLSCKNKEYRNVLNESTLLLNDGIGVRLGLKFKHMEEKENMNGTDIIPKILKFSAEREKGVFILGAKEHVIKTVPKKLDSEYENLNVSGYRNGYFNEEENQEVIDEINNSGAEILILGMGAPIQELWISRNKHKLTKIKIAIAGGAIIDFMSGKVSRAPRIVRKLNLEWLYRLCLEPRRLFARYIIGNVLFFFNIFSNRKTSI